MINRKDQQSPIAISQQLSQMILFVPSFASVEGPPLFIKGRERSHSDKLGMRF